MQQKGAKADGKHNTHRTRKCDFFIFLAEEGQEWDENQTATRAQDSGNRACGQSGKDIPCDDMQLDHLYLIGCHRMNGIFNPTEECCGVAWNIDGRKGAGYNGCK